MSINIFGLFPTPVLESNLERNLTSDELVFVDFLKQDTRLNQDGNLASTSKFVLESSELSELQKFIQHHLDFYVDNVLHPKNEFKLHITQSWINWTDKGQGHHKHYHRNSFLSGVFYINADEKNDKLYFANETNSQFVDVEINSKNFNIFNSRKWWVPASTGKLYIFPSGTRHFVEPVTTDETRISLAFNTWFSGTVGNDEELTLLTTN